MDDRIINKFLRREYRDSGWLLVAYYGLMNLMAMVAILVEGIRQGLQTFDGGAMPELDMETILNNGWGYVVAVAVGLVILLELKDENFWYGRVLHKKQPMKFGTFLVLLCACMAVQLVGSLWVTLLESVMNLFDRSVLQILESVSGDSNSFSMFLYASILAPISEELIFRGYIQHGLQRYGKRFAIVCTAFLFGIFHGNPVQIPYAFLVGLLLGYVAAEYHIIWAIALHMFNNLVLADLLTRATASLSEEITAAINLILLGSASVVTGIVLFIKRKAVLDYFHQERMDRRCIKCFFTNSGIIAITVLMLVNMVLIMTM